MAREINLVPDIKTDTIKALKLRNLIFFVSIVIAAGSIIAALIFGSIAGGQGAVSGGNTDMINKMSEVLNKYTDLSEFLTIQNQANGLQQISSNKKLLSRTFNILSAMMPTNGDTIEFSNLNINLEESTFAFEAQADAKSSPYIDYNVLDAFKKSMPYLSYDYGHYVDKFGEEIPAYCMIENNPDGTFFADDYGDLYAYWTINESGCNPSAGDGEEEDDEDEDAYDYDITEYDDRDVVLVWRTPQYDDWYEKEYMDESGLIQNVPHFESECVSYYGEENSKGDMVWTETESICSLVPDGEDGISITESSNGRDASNELVLRFSATITFDEGVFLFSNKHVIARGPSGHYNVTDSYTQLQNMFAERAKDCAPGDTKCLESK